VATEFFDDVLEQVRMILEQSDHSMVLWIIAWSKGIIDGPLEISPFRGFIDGLLDEIVCSAGELSQYRWSESMISDDNHDDDDAEGILLHPSASAAVAAQFDSSRELVAVSTRYFLEDRASLQQDTGMVGISPAQIRTTSLASIKAS